jgi:transposase
MPPARTIACLLTAERDCKSAEASRIRVAVETASPKIVAARKLLDRFRTMAAAKKTDDLTPWLRDGVSGELASFASGVWDDEAAVRAAIVEPWSNGQTEGQVTRLKLVKRQMYGRANVDLLRARMVQPG